MPDIQLKHVVSCSSEDRNNPADNLLKPEGTHKWRTAAAGEKNATVVLQFEKASQITGIDIGNEGSAFVEVLVGKSTSTDTDYQVMLVSSSFMSPTDSRSGNNRNAVRMFSADKLSKTVASEKWDRVKIVCTQPFNKSTTYGLSFIKFHSSDSGKPDTKEGVKKLGAFVVKDEDEEDGIKVGTLFKARKTETTSPPSLTGAAAVRAASRLAEEARASSTSKPRPSTSHASSLDADDDDPSAAASAKVKALTLTPSASRPSAIAAAASKGKPSPRKHAVSDEDENTEEKAPPPKTLLKRQTTSLSSVASARSSEAQPPLKKTKTEPPKASTAKEFSRLMEKVTFVLSGFQNPYRGELREKALEMGATYKPDWGRGCTHLICAFTNTPKYNQVRGRGRIISKQWIMDCYKQKQLLPWKKYRLGDAESPDDSSEEEEVTAIKKATLKRATLTPFNKCNTKNPTPKQTKTKTEAESDDDKYGGNTDSADDTDEEIGRATEKAKVKQQMEATSPAAQTKVKQQMAATTPASQTKVKQQMEANSPAAQTKVKQQMEATTPASQTKVKQLVKVSKPSPSLELFADSTDEDEGEKNSVVAMDTGNNVVGGGSDDDEDSGLPDLPVFFSEKHFFFYGDFPAAEKRLLTRYIAAYNGVLEEYMTNRVKYVVTSSSWGDDFEQAVSENPGLVFVKPQWIHSCHDKAKLMPYQPYVVVP